MVHGKLFVGEMSGPYIRSIQECLFTTSTSACREWIATTSPHLDAPWSETFPIVTGTLSDCLGTVLPRIVIRYGCNCFVCLSENSKTRGQHVYLRVGPSRRLWLRYCWREQKRALFGTPLVWSFRSRQCNSTSTLSFTQSRGDSRLYYEIQWGLNRALCAPI